MTNTRIGPKMQEARDYAARWPGCSMHELSKAVGPHGSAGYGWRTVQRALRAGMLTTRQDAPGGRHHLYAS